MEKKKLTPVQMVARELANDHGGQGAMNKAEYDLAFAGIFSLLHDRALAALRDPDSKEALALSQQYCAFGELVNTFGTALIALEDIEEAELPTANDRDGAGPGMN